VADLTLTDDLGTAQESLSILAKVADYHDDDTLQHAQRVGICARLIARALELPEPFVDLIRQAAPLHDIGKVGISRHVLLKPGKLTPVEWMHMMRHVEIGAEILAPARSPVLRLAAEIARTHHERWDGNGYVVGLAGEDIPMSGRITAVADVWDTLTHERPYKSAWTEDRAVAEIMGEAGAHFDPQVVAAFGRIDRWALNEVPDGAERAA
jgi:putative two-component system response regulator